MRARPRGTSALVVGQPGEQPAFGGPAAYRDSRSTGPENPSRLGHPGTVTSPVGWVRRVNYRQYLSRKRAARYAWRVQHCFHNPCLAAIIILDVFLCVSQMRPAPRVPYAQEVSALVHGQGKKPANLLDQRSFTFPLEGGLSSDSSFRGFVVRQGFSPGGSTRPGRGCGRPRACS